MSETTKPVNLARAAEVLTLCGVQYEVDTAGDLCFWVPAAEGDPAAFFGWLACTDDTLGVYGGLEILYDTSAGSINDLLISFQREFWAPTGYSIEYEDRVRVFGRMPFHTGAGASDRQLVAWIAFAINAVRDFALILHRRLNPHPHPHPHPPSAEELERWLDDD